MKDVQCRKKQAIASMGDETTFLAPLTAKTPIHRDNHHKNKAIFYGGFHGGAVYDKYQQNR
ncbi:hypothetical protein [Pectobacterium sp. CHL-2024]|uniref:hypothetical protein n=1 Tax=Pectobacterium sp. CHL-2024 TaxID=3377079 RepID=UPI000A613007